MWWQAKYGMTRNAAIGQSKTKLSSSEMMYAPPLFCNMMMSRPRYLACILQLRLLNGSISDEDEVAEFEVVIDDGDGMLLFKMDGSFDLSGVHIGGECCRVRPTFLQGDGMLSNKVS